MSEHLDCHCPPDTVYFIDESQAQTAYLSEAEMREAYADINRFLELMHSRSAAPPIMAVMTGLEVDPNVPPGSIVAVDPMRLPPHILEMLYRKSSFPGGGLPPCDLAVGDVIIYRESKPEPIARGVDYSTWACERGCGYDGNAADRATCEVCTRGRGD